MRAHVKSFNELHHFLPLDTCIYKILFFEDILSVFFFFFSGHVTHDLPSQSYFVSDIEEKKLDLKCTVSLNLSQNDFRNTKHKKKNLQTKGNK